jgi:hypothetical protein
MYSALGRFLNCIGHSLLLGVTHSEGFIFVGSPFCFYTLGDYEDSGLSFYPPLSWCSTPWPWVLWSEISVSSVLCWKGERAQGKKGFDSDQYAWN